MELEKVGEVELEDVGEGEELQHFGHDEKTVWRNCTAARNFCVCIAKASLSFALDNV